MPGSGDPTAGTTFDPIAGANACASTSGTDQTGVANYRLPATPDPGFTLLGSPTIVADIATTGTESELAARLVDVSPAGTETLIARGLLRPGAGGHTVFQLHPQAFRFGPGDVPKLELLPSDSPYARPSNAQTSITVSNLELRLPGSRPARLARRHRWDPAAAGGPARLRTDERPTAPASTPEPAPARPRAPGRPPAPAPPPRSSASE